MAHGNDRYTLVNDRITDQHILICKLESEITELKTQLDYLLFALEKQIDQLDYLLFALEKQIDIDISEL